jgi:hypothetical protein
MAVLESVVFWYETFSYVRAPDDGAERAGWSENTFRRENKRARSLEVGCYWPSKPSK